MVTAVPKNGAIQANATYVDGELVARDTTITNPEIAAMTTDIEAMGTMTFPTWGRIEDMEGSITKIGQDINFGKLIEPGVKNIEHRWAQTQVDANGNYKDIGCKAFWKCIPKTIPSVEVSMGDPSESEITYAIMRFRLVVDGKEMVLADRFTGDLKINGKNFSSGVKSLL